MSLFQIYRQGKARVDMGLNQTPQQEEIPAYPSSWLHVKPQLSLARPLDILNTHTMSWAQLDHTTFNSHAIYTMFTQKFACPFPETHGGLPPPITALWTSLAVWPTQEKGTHAESPEHSGSMKTPCGSFWMFSSTIYAECWAVGILYVCGKWYALIPLDFELTRVYLPCCCVYCFISLPPNSSPWSTFHPYWLCKVHSGFVFLPLIFSRGSPCKEGV